MRGGISSSLDSSTESIKNSYSLCKVTGAMWNQPLYNGNCSLINSYYCEEISGVKADNEENGGIKIEYEDLFKKSSYENWDFENVWQIQEGKTTPYLKWMKEPPEEVKKEYIDERIKNNN